MGVYYFLLLFIGIALVGMGILKKNISNTSKILFIIVGLLGIIFSVILLMPGTPFD